MFIDEVKAKFKIGDKTFPFTMTLLGAECVIASGIKGVLYVGEEEIRLRLTKKTVAVRGKNLEIAIIGGGEAYINGGVESVAFEN